MVYKEPSNLHSLLQVIEWCTHHRDDPVAQDDQERRNTDIDEWDQKYMEVDQETLFDIILVNILYLKAEIVNTDRYFI